MTIVRVDGGRYNMLRGRPYTFFYADYIQSRRMKTPNGQFWWPKNFVASCNAHRSRPTNARWKSVENVTKWRRARMLFGKGVRWLWEWYKELRVELWFGAEQEALVFWKESCVWIWKYIAKATACLRSKCVRPYWNLSRRYINSALYIYYS